MRETKAKSRMFNTLQPSEPNQEGTMTLSWSDQSEDRVANLETINRLTNEQFSSYSQIGNAIYQNSHPGREDHYLNMIA